ncbi:unnamed protein product [Amoebophrya sp. A120]|nr:unnamed protein product [Amoebophrya sp. A120]|eukprot:GSA120T00002389001.1
MATAAAQPQPLAADAILPSTFRSRVARFLPLEDGHAHFVFTGKNDDESEEHKTVALFHYLFGYAMYDTCLILTRQSVCLISTEKKVGILVPAMQAAGVSGFSLGNPSQQLPMEVTGFFRNDEKLEDKLKEFFEKRQVTQMWCLKKETHVGEFGVRIEKILAGCGEVFDLRPLVSDALACKGLEELQNVVSAAKVSVAVMQRCMIDRVLHNADKEADLKNRNVAEAVEEEFEKRTMLKKWEQDHNIEMKKLDLLYATCQSGKDFDPRPTSDPGYRKKLATQGTFLLSLGVKYCEYGASLTRTLLINATKEQKQAYVEVQKAYRAMLLALRRKDLPFAELYQIGKEALPEALQDRFLHNVGFGMGLEFRDGQLAITPKSKKTVKPGMVLCLSVGLTTTEAEPWAIWTTDTVVILPNQEVGKQDEWKVTELTAWAKKQLSDIDYELDNALPGETSKNNAAHLPLTGKGPASSSSSAGVVHTPAGFTAAASAAVISGGTAKGAGKGLHPSLGAAGMPPGAAAKGAAAGAWPGVQGGNMQQLILQQEAAARQAAQTNLQQARAGRSQRACAQQLQLAMSHNQEQVEIQKRLRHEKCVELKEKFARGYVGIGSDGQPQKKRFDLELYKGAGNLPDISYDGLGAANAKKVLEPKLILDTDKNALLVPINGITVPFAIKVVKSISVSTDHLSRSVLRMVFFTPGGGGASLDDFPPMPRDWINARRRKDREALPPERRAAYDAKPNKPLPQRMYIKELVFKSLDGRNFETLATRFKDAQKTLRAREQEQAARVGLVAQEPLKPMYQRQPPCLRDIHVRPKLTTGKATGRLEGHVNGLRFIAPRSEYVDILYTNIAHAIFEPCVDSVNTVMHFQLKNEIVINKKRTFMVQFYCEVLNVTEDLTGRRPLSNLDERQEEENERRMVNKINATFRGFIEHIHNLLREQKIDLVFQYPYQNLDFRGVHFRGHTVLHPTAHCIISLQEWPAFCVPFRDIEIAVFERFTMELKEFDLILVLKDYKKEPLRITAIPNREFGERLKMILSCQRIVWYTTEYSQKWKDLMANIVKDIGTGTFQDENFWEGYFGHDQRDEVNAQQGGSDSEAENSSKASWKPDSDDSDIEEDDEFNPDTESDEGSESDFGGGGSDETSDSSVVDLDDVPDSDEGSPRANRRLNGGKKNKANASRSTKTGQIGQKGAGKAPRPPKQTGFANPKLIARPRGPEGAASVRPPGGHSAQRKQHEGRAFK